MVNTQLHRSYYQSDFKIHTNEQEASKSEKRNCARCTGTIKNTSRKTKKQSTTRTPQTPVTRSEYGFAYHRIYIYTHAHICVYIYIYIYIYIYMNTQTNVNTFPPYLQQMRHGLSIRKYTYFCTYCTSEMCRPITCYSYHFSSFCCTDN